MLTPAEAHARLQAASRNAMDDPTESGPAIRWWYDLRGTLCYAYWRGYPQETAIRLLPTQEEAACQPVLA